MRSFCTPEGAMNTLSLRSGYDQTRHCGPRVVGCLPLADAYTTSSASNPAKVIESAAEFGDEVSRLREIMLNCNTR